MASDLSSGCTEAIEVLDEKEEGEISLEDVSSSEEGQLNFGNSRTAGQCRSCLSRHGCATWCQVSSRSLHSKSYGKKDAVQGKENRHHTKDSGHTGAKHAVSTLQEKNDDLVPISSDSDMELVGLTDMSKELLVTCKKSSKVRKKRKKRRTHSSVIALENFVSPSPSSIPDTECGSTILKYDSTAGKESHVIRSYHREQTPVHRRARSPLRSRSRPIKSPPRRYRSPISRMRSPFRKSRSPVSRKSPVRRIRSPRRSPCRSPQRILSKKVQKKMSPPGHTYLDMYGNVTKLLKKVRHLEMTGCESPGSNLNKHAEHIGSSLKEKLTHMMKSTETNTNMQLKDKQVTEEKKDKDADDEEDLALLRQKALETKQKRQNKIKTQPEVETEKCNSSLSDNDNEALELRMIALRSAVMKKHQNRVQRGLKLDKATRQQGIISRIESPFSQNFLDSITISGDEYESPLASPQTPLTLKDCMNLEDMELDSEVEQERDRDTSPYSPTDDISKQMDTEMLGIDPSDVSFISTANTINNISNFNSHQNILTTKDNYSHNSHVRNIATNLSYIQANVLYSPSDPTETTSLDFATTMRTAHQGFSTIERIPILTEHFSEHQVQGDVNQDMPYSPTDTPIYDPDLARNRTLIEVPMQPILQNCTTAVSRLSINTGTHFQPADRSALYSKTAFSHASKNTIHQLHVNNSESRIHKSETSVPKAFLRNSTASSKDNSSFRNSTNITLDDLPETETNSKLQVNLPKDLQSMKIHIPEEVTKEITEMAQEPLYLQGVPDVTKDLNKIPTLVNRSLVPVSILKTNKQLQQPLPPKKLDTNLQAEPVFKSADMQPVSIETEATKTSALFKPIKLAPVMKKLPLTITTPAAFNNSLNDSVSGEHAETEASKTVISTRSSNSVAAAERSKKILKPTDPGNAIPGLLEARANKVLVETAAMEKNEEGDNIRKKRTRARSSKNKRKTSNAVASNDKEIVATTMKSNTAETNVNLFSLYQQIKNPSKSNKSKRQSATVSNNKKAEVHSKGVDEKNVEDESNVTAIAIKHSIEKRVESEVKDIKNDKNYEMAQDKKTNDTNKKDERISSENLNPNIINSAQSNADTATNVISDKKPESIANSTSTIESRRRSSLDEDEEALRAILLASLAKRSKPSESVTPTNKPISVGSNLSDTTTSSNSTPADKVNVNDLKTPEHLVFISAIKTPNLSSESSSKSSLSSETKSVDPTSTEPVTETQTQTKIDPEVVKNIFLAGENSDSSPSSTIAGKKRTNPVVVKGPPKKVVRKAPITASTKVVNNAKKFQNTLVQKKLSLQKVATIYNAQKTTGNRTLFNNQFTEKNRPLSPMTSATERFIINLGSDSDSDSEPEQGKTNVALTSNSSSVEKRQPLAIPTTDFERSVDLFLRDVRKKQESAAAIKTSNPTNPVNKPKATQPTSSAGNRTMSSTLHTTPLAVRHLPASRQEEYRRLKQQILEHERLKLQRALEINSAPISPGSKSIDTSPGPLSPASPSVSSATSKSSENPATGISKQALGSQSTIAITVKDNGPRNVSILTKNTSLTSSSNPSDPQSAEKSILNVSPKIGSTFPKITSSPKSMTNLNIQIPNSTLSRSNLTANKIVHSSIPTNTSQTANLISTSIAQEKNTNKSNIVNSNNSSKEFLASKAFQIRVKQGEADRTVIINESSLSNKAKSNVKLNEVASVSSINQKNNMTQMESITKTLQRPIVSDSVNISEVDKGSESSQSIDSEASTLILTQEDKCTADSEDTASSTLSTVKLLDTLELNNSSTISMCIKATSSKNNSLANVEREKSWGFSSSMKDNIRTEMNVINTLPLNERSQCLTEMETKLVAKRYTVLNDLKDMSKKLQQWEIERDLQNNLAAEVKRLREELRMAEEKLQLQKSRVHNMVPKVTAAHEKINDGRKECYKLSRICSGLGSKIIGEKYKVPTDGAQLLTARLKEVAVRTRLLSRKKVPFVENIQNFEGKSTSETQDDVRLSESYANSIQACTTPERNEINLNNSLSENNKQSVDDEKIEKTILLEDLNRTSITAPLEIKNDNALEKNSSNLEDKILLLEPKDVTETSTGTRNEKRNTNVEIETESRVEVDLTSTSATSMKNEERLYPETPMSPIIHGMLMSEDSTKSLLTPYSSVLLHLRTPRTTNPEGILCPYELMGTCRDGDCQFVHHNAAHS
ncbi:uncharacterized protein LOC107266815 isoform X2 [Cephus cinctus]|uniref:Uncharacterized protein LOC107266815 isoform X2 n=1 Tax=Cephus cinctus TaxID=211228 RepID=A0AAJ7FIA2_CEPCN|nr:uncharacterized protein LOC107266815 isoform X2 [Cephus cinctus]